jgi:hypothetical protein
VCIVHQYFSSVHTTSCFYQCINAAVVSTSKLADYLKLNFNFNSVYGTAVKRQFVCVTGGCSLRPGQLCYPPSTSTYRTVTNGLQKCVGNSMKLLALMLMHGRLQQCVVHAITQRQRSAYPQYWFQLQTPHLILTNET